MSSSALSRCAQCALLFLAGCRSSPPPATLDTVAHDYVSLALALGERDPDSLDFSTAPDFQRKEVTQHLPSLNEIAEQAATLRARLESLPDAPQSTERRHSLALQLVAIRARAAVLQGHPLSFDSEAEALFAIHRLPDPGAVQREQLRHHIASLLPPTRKPVSLADRYAAYEARFVLAPQHLAPVLQAALASCRRRTREHLVLPPYESVELTFVSHRPWVAFSRYLGHAHSIIEINLDQPLTVDDALELACHEGYPGHHVFNTLRDPALRQQPGPPESRVQLTSSPQGFVAEAMAAYAPRLAFNLAERTVIERDLLFPLAGLPSREANRYVLITGLVRQLDSAEPAIARDYLDGRLDFVRAEQRLAQEALMANAAPTLLYLNQYRSYMLAYTDGPRRVAALPAASPWTTYEDIVRNPWFRFEDFKRRGDADSASAPPLHP